ncbi:MAG: molybdopterin-dependent oxidoreductase [Prolixibacteraceae bacterium]|nr:molybdopterin-dependent oxidoreductase [Prolixibacteraceae bacterium]
MSHLTKPYKSTCSYCGVGCGVIVTKNKNGKVSVKGDPDHPVNKGKLCSKGLNLHYVVNKTDDRLLVPQMRAAKGYPLKQVEWPVAVERVSQVFKTLIEKFGPDSVGFYVSGQCLTEEYYVATKLAKGFWKTNNIDTNSRLCMSSAVVGYKMQLGEDAVPIAYEDIELADCFFITGANPAWCHPILFRRIEAHKMKNPDVKIIVADPRHTQSCSVADLHLPLNPGTDVFLNNAIGRCLIEDGNIDQKFINEHATGFKDYQQKVMETSLEKAAEICGVSIEDIRLAASYIGNAKGYISMWAMGLNQSVIGVNKNLSLINLSLITGQIGKPGSGPFSLTGQPNAMGGREVGGMCNLLPAHRDLANENHRKEVADFWGVENIPAKPGYSATEMIDALDSGKLKAIWIICTNPLVSLPNSAKVEAALKKAKFVVVQDISEKSDTVPFADVVFPAAGWLEKEGTMTNSERRISYLEKVIDGPGKVLPDYEIICRVARQMGYPGFEFRNSQEVFDEYKQLTAGTHISIEKLDYNYLKEKGTAQWPFLGKDDGRAKRLFEDGRFFTPDQKARILAVNPENESEPPTSEYPLVLTTCRVRDQWHTMTRTGKVEKLRQHIDGSFLEMNSKDADSRHLNDGDIVEILGNRGTVQVPLKITDEIKAGVVFLPMHWGKIFSGNSVRTNNLTLDLVDPKSKEPDFKYSVVEVRKFRKEKETILIAGAGAAALEFVRAFRKKNTSDEIIILSKETEAFYNRILLPDFISGSLSWTKLQKTNKEELAQLNVQLIAGVGLKKIDKDKKLAYGTKGQQYTYDKLILATGSRANSPKALWASYPRVYTIRDIKDAELFNHELKTDDRILVVGGGLLGLEMAGALLELGIDTSLVNRNPRLMDRQLDDESGTMLKEILQEKGLTILFNDEISQVIPVENRHSYEVTFKSGNRVRYNAIVLAVGTRPNIEYATDVLQLRRGILVNEYLQTSDPHIFAIGEIAEFKGNLYGITSAAEEQARVLAAYLHGNTMSFYSGSVLMNLLKFPGIDLCSIGLSTIPDDSGEYEEVVFLDRAERYYKKCIVKGDVLVGAILMGDKAEFTEFRKLIVQKTELAGLRKKLLRTGKASEPMLGKIICSCNNVGEGNILKVIEKGSTDLDSVCEKSGAGLGCGSCRPEIKEIMKEFSQPILIT